MVGMRIVILSEKTSVWENDNNTDIIAPQDSRRWPTDNVTKELV